MHMYTYISCIPHRSPQRVHLIRKSFHRSNIFFIALWNQTQELVIYCYRPSRVQVSTVFKSNYNLPPQIIRSNPLKDFPSANSPFAAPWLSLTFFFFYFFSKNFWVQNKSSHWECTENLPKNAENTTCSYFRGHQNFSLFNEILITGEWKHFVSHTFVSTSSFYTSKFYNGWMLLG